MKKSIYVYGALLAGIVVCMSVFFGLREHKERELQGKSNFTPKNNGIAAASLTAPRGNPKEELLTLDERTVQGSINNFTSLYSEEELATSEKQRRLEIMNSPEYLEYTKNAREKGYWFRQHVEFWESHGFPYDRSAHRAAFRDKFNAEPEDYEPEMRLKMAKLLLSQEFIGTKIPEELASSEEEALHIQRLQVYLKFLDENGTWLSAQFGIDWEGIALGGWEEGAQSNPAFIWVTDVQRNAESIVAAAETTGVDTPEAQGAVPSWDMSSVMESPSVSDSETEMPATVNTSEHDPMTDTEIEAAIEKSLIPQVSDIPQNQRPETAGEIPSNLETSLKAQFSSARFDRAMKTLDRYGPEEGLRRLRQSDPEVAKRIEQHRNKSRSEASDKSEEEVSQ